jgi:hypothetical protein
LPSVNNNSFKGIFGDVGIKIKELAVLALLRVFIKEKISTLWAR